MLPWNEILLRLLLAALLGGLVGLERERKNWAAGLRTHMMVCLGAALIMIVSSFGFSDILGTENVNLDPSRVAAQVVSGIGFIGAGAILFRKTAGTVRGITTAAGLWTVAAIGLATGGGMYFAAFITTVLAVLILWALPAMERKYLRMFKMRTLFIVLAPKTNISSIIKLLEDQVNNPMLDINMYKRQRELFLEIQFDKGDVKKLAEAVKSIEEMDEVKRIYWN